MFGENSFAKELWEEVMLRGGFYNAHAHITRANTWQKTGPSPGDLSLAQKHKKLRGIVDAINREGKSAFRQRVGGVIDRQFTRHGVGRIDTCVEIGGAIGVDWWQEVGAISDMLGRTHEVRLGVYWPYQMCKYSWPTYERTAEHADFVVGLVDVQKDPLEYTKRILLIADNAGIPAHFHVDQKNLESENQTEQLVGLVKDMKPRVKIWAVHMISPSAYKERRFVALARSMAKMNVGVICCPSCALSMRWHGSKARTHNSIARVWDLMREGVEVKVGTDNIGDVMSPTTTESMLWEVMLLATATRHYDIDDLATVATYRA
jgi:hypothetical protein